MSGDVIRGRASHELRRQLDRFQNPTKGKVLELVNSFDENWRNDLDAFIVDEKAGALGSIVSERHRIAHGENSTISYSRVKDYRDAIDDVIDRIADLVDPPAGGA